MLSKLNFIQIDKLSGYFIDLAKVWFATGVIGFFISNSMERLSIENVLGGVGASFAFLMIGMVLLKAGNKSQ